MDVRVLVVDDSAFFRQRISEILSRCSNITVIGTARDGLDAVEKNQSLKPDVITMDVEMPKLNGIEAVRQIMRERPTQILMVSSLTHDGAQVTLQAMEAGAVDYLTKDMRAWMDKSQSLYEDLTGRIIALGRSKYFVKSSFLTKAAAPKSSHRNPTRPVDNPRRDIASARASSAIISAAKITALPLERGNRPSVPVRCKIIVIGTSTGGPAALQEILTKLPASFPYPILLVQHMPNTFTKVFAERLNKQCAIEVKHAESGDKLKAGRALLAPGGMQMILDGTRSVQILQGDTSMTYKPSVDVTFASVAKHFTNKALGIVLTGMGADGCDGAKLLKSVGSDVWSQSQATCTIYGMPQAVAKAGVVDNVIDLKDFASCMSS